VTQREARLRGTHRVGRNHSRRQVRRWLGRQLVRVGAWVAAEPTAKAAWA